MLFSFSIFVVIFFYMWIDSFTTYRTLHRTGDRSTEKKWIVQIRSYYLAYFSACAMCNVSAIDIWLILSKHPINRSFRVCFMFIMIHINGSCRLQKYTGPYGRNGEITLSIQRENCGKKIVKNSIVSNCYLIHHSKIFIKPVKILWFFFVVVLIFRLKTGIEFWVQTYCQILINFYGHTSSMRKWFEIKKKKK